MLFFIFFYFCRGPSEENVPPHEASERLQLFQARFDELWRKYISLSSGEELFGLPVTGTFSENVDTWSNRLFYIYVCVCEYFFVWNLCNGFSAKFITANKKTNKIFAVNCSCIPYELSETVSVSLHAHKQVENDMHCSMHPRKGVSA